MVTKLRNLNVVIHVEQKKTQNPNDVLAKHKAQIPAKEGAKERPEFKAKPRDEERRPEVTKTSKSSSATKTFKNNTQKEMQKVCGRKSKIQFR
jgi:hypothetical protein